MRNYSIRDLCREAADPTTPVERLDYLADEARIRLRSSHRVRLIAALLSNPAAPLGLADALIAEAPARISCRSRASRSLFRNIRVQGDDERLPASLCRALASNPAWNLHRLADPPLSGLLKCTRERLANSLVWPAFSEVWWQETADSFSLV